MILQTENEARAFVATLCDETAMQRLDVLVRLLAEENARQNLVAKPTLDKMWQRHIADSAQLLQHVPRETLGPWLDLGTGAGFPGMVIAAMRPKLDISLVESRKRRVEWLESVADALELPCCKVIGCRLEAVESYPASVISARAFAPLTRLVELSARFSTNDTLWLLPKGRSAAQDLASLPASMAKLFHVEQSLTDSEAGIIVGRLEQRKRLKA